MNDPLSALIVEDRPEMANMWENAIRQLDPSILIHKTDTLAHAKILCRAIPPPNLLFLDLGLPDSDHVQTADAIPEFAIINPDMVVMVISGLITADTLDDIISKGAHAAREKIDMRKQVDLWRMVDEALKKGPPIARDALGPFSGLISRLASLLNLL